MYYLDIRPSGIFRSVDWYLVTDVSGIYPSHLQASAEVGYVALKRR
jgi:hypothetical protein